MNSKLTSLKEALDLIFKDHPWHTITNCVSRELGYKGIIGSNTTVLVMLIANDGETIHPDIKTIEKVEVEYHWIGDLWSDPPFKQFCLHYTLNDEWILLYK